MGWTVRGLNPGGARFSARPDRPWPPPSLLYNVYRLSLGGKERAGRDADHSPPSSAEVLEEQSYTSTPLWATTGPVTGLLYLFFFLPASILNWGADYPYCRVPWLPSGPSRNQQGDNLELTYNPFQIPPNSLRLNLVFPKLFSSRTPFGFE